MISTIFVNNDSTSYDKSSLPSCKDGIEDKMLGSFCVSLIKYSFLQDIIDVTFAALYLITNSSTIGRNLSWNFGFDKVTSSKFWNLWVLAIP